MGGTVTVNIPCMIVVKVNVSNPNGSGTSTENIIEKLFFTEKYYQGQTSGVVVK